MKNCWRLLGTIWVLLMVTVAGGLTAVSAGMLYARHQGLLLLSVQSDSMRPQLERGDAIIVQRHRGVRPGQIIVYHSLTHSGQLVTHRLIQIRPDGSFLTKGDNLEYADIPITTSQVLGTVDKVVPHLGAVLDFTRRPVGLIAIVYLPLGGLLIWEIYRLSQYYQGRRYRLTA